MIYSQKGFTIYDTKPSALQTMQRDDIYRLYYITVSVNIAYTPRLNGQGIQFAAGGYVDFLLGGHLREQTTYSSSYYNYGSTGSYSRTTSYAGSITHDPAVIAGGNVAYYSAKTDAGLKGSVGYRYGGALLQVGYSLGLRDLGYKSSAYGTSYYNRAFQLSLTYLFNSAKPN